jgi:hypothetical protein
MACCSAWNLGSRVGTGNSAQGSAVRARAVKSEINLIAICSQIAALCVGYRFWILVTPKLQHWNCCCDWDIAVNWMGNIELKVC